MEEQERKYESELEIKSLVAKTYKNLRQENKGSAIMDITVMYLFWYGGLENIVNSDDFKTDDEVIKFVNNELFNRFELKEVGNTYDLFDKIDNTVVLKCRKDCLGYTMRLCDEIVPYEDTYIDRSHINFVNWHYPEHIKTFSYMDVTCVRIQPVNIAKYGDSNDSHDRVTFTFQFGIPAIDYFNNRIEEAYVYWHDDKSNATIKIRQSCNVDVNNDLRVIIAFKDYILPIVRKILKEDYES